MLEEIRPELFLVAPDTDVASLKHFLRNLAPVNLVTVDAANRSEFNGVAELESEFRAHGLVATGAQVPAGALNRRTLLAQRLRLPVKRLRSMAVPTADFARVCLLVPQRELRAVTGQTCLRLPTGIPGPHGRGGADVLRITGFEVPFAVSVARFAKGRIIHDHLPVKRTREGFHHVVMTRDADVLRLDRTSRTEQGRQQGQRQEDDAGPEETGADSSISSRESL